MKIKFDKQLIIALVSLFVSIILFVLVAVAEIMIFFACLTFGFATIMFAFVFKDVNKKQIERYQDHIQDYVKTNNQNNQDFNHDKTLAQMHKNRKKYIKQMRFSLFVLISCGAALIVTAFLYLIL